MCRVARMTSTNKYSEFIRNRHSPRAFLPEPMPVEDIKQVLEDAQSAPSNSNTQPWHVHVVGGEKLKELSAALIKDSIPTALAQTSPPITVRASTPSVPRNWPPKCTGCLALSAKIKKAA